MLDKKDEKILGVLKENSRLSTQKISKKAGIPITTVHNRLRKLTEEKVIKRFTIDIDYKAIGKTLLAYLLVSVDNIYCKRNNITHSDVMVDIKKHAFVESSVTITGETDLLVGVRVKDIRELDDFLINHLRPINGVLKTDTKIVLEEAP